jgi:RNA polymerase sigma-32 factor
VKVGTVAAQKKLFFNLRKIKAKLGLYEEGDIPALAAETIAQRLDVTTQEVQDMNRRLSKGDSSLNQPVGEDMDLQRQDLLVDDRPSQETVLADRQEKTVGMKLLKEAMGVLSPRERVVIEQRRLIDEPRTLEDIGADFGISRERVRQIENKAFEKLQKAVLEASRSIEAAVSKALPKPAAA